MILITITSVPGNLSNSFVFFSIYIIAIGTGGIKPNVSTLGADQFDESNEEEKKEKESFFNWFYWSINLGALVAYTVVASICQYGITSLGGPSWAFFDGYLIPTIAMFFAIVIFIIGASKYKIAKPSGSILLITNYKLIQ